MAESLKQCPLCGCTPRLQWRDEGVRGREVRIGCDHCGINTNWMPEDLPGLLGGAEARWQRLPRLTDLPPVQTSNDWDPSHPKPHGGHDWDPPHWIRGCDWRCLKCGLRVSSGLLPAGPCPASPATVLPRLLDPEHISSPRNLADEVARLNSHIIALNAHVRALEARRA